MAVVLLPCKSGCGRAVTGVTREHCCRACAFGKGRHGPACANIVIGVPAAAARGHPAPHSVQPAHQPAQAAHPAQAAQAAPHYIVLKNAATGHQFGPFVVHRRRDEVVCLATAEKDSTAYLRIDSAKGGVDTFGKGGPFAQFRRVECAPSVFTLQCVGNSRFLSCMDGEMCSDVTEGNNTLWGYTTITERDVAAADNMQLSPVKGLSTDDPNVRLSAEQKQFFAINGFLHVKNAVPLPMVHKALAFINQAMCTPGAVTQSATGMTFCEELKKHPSITALLYSSPAWSYCQRFLGKGRVAPCRAGQIALRGPHTQHYGTDREDKEANRWHVDGLEKGIHSSFSMLVGVTLSSAMQRNQGNFTVWPGSHKTLLPLLKDAHTQSKPLVLARPDLGHGTQILADAGDLVFAHHKLAHKGGMNTGHDIRYQVYFRVAHIAHLEQATSGRTLDDLWVQFEGLSQV